MSKRKANPVSIHIEKLIDTVIVINSSDDETDIIDQLRKMLMDMSKKYPDAMKHSIASTDGLRKHEARKRFIKTLIDLIEWR